MRAFLKKEKSGRYGSIYARHVVEHFFPGDLRKLFKAVHRVIKKSGRFITVFPNARNLSVSMYEFWNDETHARPYPGETVKKMLEESGFKIVESGPDKDSWDNAALKNIARGIRSMLTGIPAEPPDYFIVAEK
jgi:predicted SAM-dependent methyltransferase